MKKSMWEKFQDQKEEPWAITDWEEYKEWYSKCVKYE